MDVDGTILCCERSNNVKGVICASQIATGEENSFVVKVYGEKAGLEMGTGKSELLVFNGRRKTTTSFKTRACIQ